MSRGLGSRGYLNGRVGVLHKKRLPGWPHDVQLTRGLRRRKAYDIRNNRRDLGPKCGMGVTSWKDIETKKDQTSPFPIVLVPSTTLKGCGPDPTQVEQNHQG